MISLLPGLGALAVQTQSRSPVGAKPVPRLSVEFPEEISVEGVSAKRTIAEFMDVCIRPQWNVASIQKAARESEFRYALDHSGKTNRTAYRWHSRRGRLSLVIDPDWSQCALSVGSNQPRTGEQVLSMLKPAVEAELGRRVDENDQSFNLEWAGPQSNDLERITSEDATAISSQAIFYLFDRTAPGVREKLDSLTQVSK